MKLDEAAKQKALAAERQISPIRAMVIVFSASSSFLLPGPPELERIKYIMIALCFLYGSFVFLYKPYEKMPVLSASWFTFISDGILTTLWVYATNGFYSPYFVIYYASIIAVAFRFNLLTTIVTGLAYTSIYGFMIIQSNQWFGHQPEIAVRCGFILLLGVLGIQITRETLFQTQQRVKLQRLMAEAAVSSAKQLESQRKLEELNTRLALSNNVFRHAEENAHIASYVIDPNTGELSATTNLNQLLRLNENGINFQSREQLLQMVHPEDRELVESEWHETRDGTRTSLQRFIAGDGKLVYLRSSSRIMGEDGHTRLIVTLQDVTPDVELNETLQTKNQELERSNAELESFSYIASHDLQEPVRKINTFSELILDRESESLSQTSRMYLSRISAAATRMQFLIRAFLNYSHINRQDIVFEQVDLNDVMREVIQNLNDQIDEKKAEIRVDPLPVINGVLFQMQQLFMNLIGNALKYSKTDVQPVIHIHAEKVAGKEIERLVTSLKPYYWKISVEDNGIGFDQKYAEKIFEVFQRLHSKDKYAGTGIGLAICKKIAQTHQGIIQAQGIPDQGASFQVYLPA